MTIYRVAWEIDIDADSPREAAREALKIQRREGSIATVFTVFDENGDHHNIDLDAERHREA